MTARLLAACIALCLLALPLPAVALRLATYDAGLTRPGPGLLLRDIRRGKDPQIAAGIAVIARVNPDVLLLTGFDYDAGGAALRAYAARLAAAGAAYPHLFALPPNAGVPTGRDLDGDGRRGGPGDAQGWGHFAGQGGMALLSRLPIAPGARDLSALLWRDLPGSRIDGAGLSPAAMAVQRLSSTGHWIVPLRLPGGGVLRILAFAATPPVFDGPEDRNGRRNADEIALWRHLLDGRLGPAPPPPLAILGKANLDPAAGEGRHEAIRALLADPRLQDPRPGDKRSGGRSGDRSGGGPGAGATAIWPKGPGALRVDYVLPSAGLRVTGAGVFRPGPGQPLATAAAEASAHRLVWVDIAP